VQIRMPQACMKIFHAADRTPARQFLDVSDGADSRSLRCGWKLFFAKTPQVAIESVVFSSWSLAGKPPCTISSPNTMPVASADPDKSSETSDASLNGQILSTASFAESVLE
jgi:hypothetical protein